MYIHNISIHTEQGSEYPTVGSHNVNSQQLKLTVRRGMLRPVHLLRVWLSEGLTQGDS